MPETPYVQYVDDRCRPLAELTLIQSPSDSRFFRLGQTIGRRPEGFAGPVEWLNPDELSDRDGAPRTDLASVPWFLWSFVASYGRQTVPALFHDRDADRAFVAGRPADRRQADDEFFVGLRSNRVPWLRATLMWAAVRTQGLWSYAPAACVALVLHVLTVVAVIVYGVVSLVRGIADAAASPALIGVGAIVLALATLWLWGSNAGLALTLTLFAAVFGAPVLLATACVGFFRLAELVGKPFDRRGGSILYPTVGAEAMRYRSLRDEETRGCPDPGQDDAGADSPAGATGSGNS